MSGEARCIHCGAHIQRNEGGDKNRRWVHWDDSGYYYRCKSHAEPPEWRDPE